MAFKCETCMYYAYDEYQSQYVCDANMDEDEIYRLSSMGSKDCPYYSNGDEYSIVRKQI